MDSCNDRYVDRANELYPNAVINNALISSNVTVWCIIMRACTQACTHACVYRTNEIKLSAVINNALISSNVTVWRKNAHVRVQQLRVRFLRGSYLRPFSYDSIIFLDA